MNDSTKSRLILHGLNGANPLAFLAAVGTLRTLTQALPDRIVRMGWCSLGVWQPALFVPGQPSAQSLIELLYGQLEGNEDRPEFTSLGPDLTVDPLAFVAFAREAAGKASPTDRTTADFAAAFGCETTLVDNAAPPTIQDTAFRTMAGAGHQHFLGFMRNIIRATRPEHLYKALFETWRYDDPVQNLTLRWDPIDDVRYALQWRNPSGDPARKDSGSVLGANRLAIEGLPLFPTAPVGSRLATTGFKGKKSTNTYWTWPIWEPPVTLDVVRSLVSLKALQEAEPVRAELEPRGIREVFRSQRLTIGKVKNFTPAQAV